MYELKLVLTNYHFIQIGQLYILIVQKKKKNTMRKTTPDTSYESR